jgi:potassium efflux system protein
LLNKALVRKAKLDIYQVQLNTFGYELDSLMSAPAIFKFPKDSVHLKRYMQQMVVVAHEGRPVDSVLKQAKGNVLSLLNDINMTVFKLQSGIDEIARGQTELADNAFKREFPNIWSHEKYSRPFDEILSQSKNKAILTSSFFFENNKGKLALMFILIIVAYVYLRSLKSIYVEKNLNKESSDKQLVLRYPVLTAIIIVINLYQFLFTSQPFIINVLFGLISGISLSILFKKNVSPYWLKLWFTLLFMFIITSFDNLILQASRPERWFMLLFAIIGVIASKGCHFSS